MIRRNQILEIDVDEHGGLTSGATSHENPYADIRPCGFLNLRRLSELFNRLRMHFHGSIPWLEFGRASACVPSRWKVLSGEFRRRPTALVIKFRKPDRVGRRGLSEPREDFSRLTTYAFLWIDSVAQIQSRIRLRFQPLESSLGRVPQAADGTCNKISQTRSCRSPRTV